MVFGLFGKKKVNHLVVVSYEGPGSLRLNGNRILTAQVKKNASSHDQTVCWIEFTPDGARRDQGTGPSASRLEPAELERLERELPQTQACRTVLEALQKGQDRSGLWLPWSVAGKAKRGTRADQGRTK